MRRAKTSIRGRALWQTLAIWMLPGLVFLMAAGLMLTARGMHDVANSAYDRSLSGAIRAIALNISTESGGVGVELPYPLFESFQVTAEGEVYFRISTDDGLVQIGEALLAPPPTDLIPGQMRFYDSRYLGRDVRAGVLMSPVSHPLYGAAEPQNLIIEVAETTGSRTAFRRLVLQRALLRDVGLIVGAALLLGLGVHAALQPLRALRERLDERAADDLRQVDPSGLPHEVQPLVASMNRLVDRHRLQGEAQRRFIEDASHQLKTPLAVMQAQIDYAKGLSDPEEIRSVLEALRQITDRSARLTSQLLALARARNAALWATEAAEAVTIPALLQEVARLHLPAARRRRIALELDLPPSLPQLHLAEALLFEAVSNLVDNAITVSPRGGNVILSAGESSAGVWIEIRDQGPGIAPEILARLRSAQRFRAATGRSLRQGNNEPADISGGGNGLGLSIVQEILKAFGAALELENLPEGGLSARMLFPQQVAQKNITIES